MTTPSENTPNPSPNRDATKASQVPSDPFDAMDQAIQEALELPDNEDEIPPAETAAESSEGDDLFLDETGMDTPEKPSENSPEKASPSTPKPASEKGPSSPSYQDPYEGVEEATEEEVKRVSSRDDNRDLEEDFERFAKTADKSSRELQKAYHELRLRLHSHHTEIKKSQTYHITAPIHDFVRLISAQLGISIGEFIESAVLMFYANISEERSTIGDLGLALDSLTLQVQEMGIETSKLSDMAALALESEFSPLESRDFSQLAGQDKPFTEA